MIGHFPTPHPDELLFSICARFYDRVSYIHRSAVSIELFANLTSAGVIALPRRIGYLVAQLPSGHQLTIDRLIDSHTLLRLYSPFMIAKRTEQVRESMGGSDSDYRGIGNVRTRVNAPTWLRFCPACSAKDKKAFSERYWHRLHQVLSVEVCPEHAVFLENSTVRVRNRGSESIFISAEKAIQTAIPRQLDLSNPEHKVLLDIANDVDWLLNKCDVVPTYEALHDAYVNLLRAQGLASPGGIIKVSKLVEILRTQYSSAMLERLACQFDERKTSNWPSRFVKDFRINKFHDPLEHLLIIRLLGYTAESFFNLCTKERATPMRDAKPFGDGPWPCLNPVCKDFREPVVVSCKVICNWLTKHVSQGTFACTCGFIYVRSGPDQSPDDQARCDFIKKYGWVWETAFKSMWNDRSISISEIARRLGINYKTAIPYAVQLGLKFPRLCPNGRVAKITPAQRKCFRRSTACKFEVMYLFRLEIYRKKWLQALKKNPKATQGELQRKFPTIYCWLYRHDKEWLCRNSPMPGRRVKLGNKYLDWISLDAQLAEQVRFSAKKFINSAGRPVRLTASAICRDLNKSRHILTPKYLDQLPQTAKALSDVLETNIDLYLRRIEWASGQFREESIMPSFIMLARRASIKRAKWSPEVKEAIETARESLLACFESTIKAA